MTRSSRYISDTHAGSGRAVPRGMRTSRFHFPFSVVTVCSVTAATLFVVYIGLIAVVMSYATLTVESSQLVKNGEAEVAVLDSQYLSNISRIENLDYRSIGYALPSTKTFVPRERMTALR